MKNMVFFKEARCNVVDRLFFVRYDYAADDCWVYTYGIKEIPNQNKISNDIIANQYRRGPQYKCPYCANKGMFECGACGSINCYDDKKKIVECVVCKRKNRVEGYIDNIKSETSMYGQ